MKRPRPLHGWGGADESPAVYVNANYLLDATIHAGHDETVGLGAKELDPVVVDDGRGRWAVVMPIRS